MAIMRPEPTPVSGIPRAIAYGLIHRAHSAWTRRRYRASFEEVKRFCLFVGYPRSGHSIVGAVLNAHRSAVISHELIVPPLILGGCDRDGLYAQIIARANWFNLRGNRTNYRYGIPGQWQGRFRSLRVIGDKRGGTVTLTLETDPDLLQRTRILTQVPLRLIHVIRNPWDNIAAISIWHKLTPEASADFYFRHWRVTDRLGEFASSEEVLAIHHEDFIEWPRETIAALCSHLDLELYPGYLADCCAVLFDRPTYTRRKIDWSPELLASVAERVAQYPLLKRYAFELPKR